MFIPHALKDVLCSFLYLSLVSIIQFSTLSAAYALKPRLAILELQGSSIAIEQKQMWTDFFRQHALKSLPHLLILDRSHFKILLDPKRNLEACADLCEAELAQELGVDWTLSSRLTQQFESSSFSLTLKLYRSDGALVNLIQHRDIQLKSFNEPALSAVKRVLKPLLSMPQSIQSSSIKPRDQIHPQEMRIEGEDGEDEEDLDESFNKGEGEEDEEEDKETITQDKKRLREESRRRESFSPSPSASQWMWFHFPQSSHPQFGICLSPLITVAQYQACVDQGHCSPPSLNGSCKDVNQNPHAPIRCIHLQQALQYAVNQGGRLPLEKEWKVIQPSCPTCFSSPTPQNPHIEWLNGPFNSSSFPSKSHFKRANQWARLWSKAPRSHLRKAKKIPTLSVNHSKKTLRFMPPSFQISTLGFRIVIEQPQGQLCTSL